MSHSPLPWKVGFEHASITSDFSKRYPSGVPVVAPCAPFAFGACAAMAGSADDAEYIVRCVNAHEALIKGLKYLLSTIEAADFDLDAVVKNTAQLLHVADGVRQAREALKLAGEA